MKFNNPAKPPKTSASKQLSPASGIKSRLLLLLYGFSLTPIINLIPIAICGPFFPLYLSVLAKANDLPSPWAFHMAGGQPVKLGPFVYFCSGITCWGWIGFWKFHFFKGAS